MEATPLLRFVCATFAMRYEWEGNAGNVKRSLGVVADRSTDCAKVWGQAQAPRSVDAKQEDICGAMFPASPAGVEDKEDDIDGWMMALEVAMVAHTDQEAAEIVGSVCKEASTAGVFGDLVAMVITTVLDMGDATSEVRQQGIIEVILRMCFERATNTTDWGKSDTVETPYCTIVLEQLVETMRNLLELVGEDEVGSHMGGRLLERTLHAINENMQAQLDEGEVLVL